MIQGFILFVVAAACGLAAVVYGGGGVVQVSVNIDAPTSSLNLGFKKCVGSGHAELGLRSLWRDHLKRAHDDLGFEYVRFHGIFDDELSGVLGGAKCDQYSWFNIDQVYDYILSIGMKPLVELSFTPGCMASGDPFIFWYHANGNLPKDMSMWTNFLKATLNHWIDRYGIQTVRQFYFEFYNEPNCGFFNGTQTQYFDWYAQTATAIKSVDSSLLVGGPSTCQVGWVDAFYDYCQKNKVSVDFVSSHLYPTDPNLPVGDRRGFSNAIAKAASQVPSNIPLLMTEYNAGLGIQVLDSAYAASFIVYQIPWLSAIPNLKLWSYWTFTDVFEEGGQESIPFDSDSFGMQTIHGVPKPIYRAFELLNQASSQQFQTVQSPSMANSQVVSFSVLADPAKKFGKSAVVYLTNFDIKGQAITNQSVTITVSRSAGWPATPISAAVYIVSDTRTNPHQAWINMGKPAYPTAQQISQLVAASEVQPFTLKTTRVSASQVSVSVDLDPYAVAALVFPL
eukprot:ANDGO_00547.mRNA.1 Beta-xylosidase